MTQPVVTILDDDVLFTRAVVDRLGEDRFEVRSASSLMEGRRLAPGADVLILDNQLPDGQGLSLLSELKAKGWQPKVVLVTANPDYENAVEALRLNIDDYLEKPVELERLRGAVHRCLSTVDLQKVERLGRPRRAQKRQELRLVGGQAFAEVRKLIEQASCCQLPVLISGETGVGKSLIAQAIHDRSKGSGPLISVNCAALPDSLIEAELFGVEKGAFTGASEARPGLFELADRGTLFLDEIGELTPVLQAKLLGVLDDKRVRRLAGREARRFEARVIAATNIDPESAVAANRFRQDLFYRLNVLRIRAPALRERSEDLAELCGHLLERIHPEIPLRLADSELGALAAYPWPGNVRELRNVLERSALLDPPDALRPSALLGALQNAGQSPSALASPACPPPAPDPRTLEQVEREHILNMVGSCATLAEAAERLRIGSATLRRKLQRYRSS